MKSRIYFVESPTSVNKIKPDFLERAKMNINQAVFIATPYEQMSAFKARGPVKMDSQIPIPDGLQLGDDPFSCCSESLWDTPPSFGVGNIYKSHEEGHENSDSHPLWFIHLKTVLSSWLRNNNQMPLLIHFPGELDDITTQMIVDLLKEIDLPAVWVNGTEEDNSQTLEQLRLQSPVMTCLTAPDSKYLRAAWSHLKQGSVWLWFSPFPPEWLTQIQYTLLPVEVPLLNKPNSKDRVTLVDRAALMRQIKGIKIGNNEASKYSYLTSLTKPKKLILANEIHFKSIKLMQKRLPQFNSLLQQLSNRILLQAMNSLPLHLGNTLLAGAPGNGKTWLCEQIAMSLDVPFLSIQLAGTNDIMILRGSQQQWSSADAGRPAKFIAECPIANPIIMIDEVDKTSGSHHGNLSEALLMLLEPENARRFMDNFVETPINMSHVSYILTANNLALLSDYLKTRVEITEVLPPTDIELRNLAQQLYSHQLQSLKAESYFEAELQPPELALLIQDCTNIRTLKQRVNRAIENALSDIQALDTLRSQVTHLCIKPEKPIVVPIPRTIGFLDGRTATAGHSPRSITG